MKPLRILFYTAVDCSHPGGVQSVVAALEQGLEQRGHAVISAWSAPPGRAVPGKQVVDLHLREGGRKAHLPSLWRSFILLARTRPDIVHCHFLTGRAWYFLFWRRLFGCKVVLTAHGSDLMRTWPIDAPHLPSLLARADAVTAVSERLVREAADRAGLSEASVALISNGIDTRFFRPPGAPVERKPDAQTLVSVGRLEEVKGHDLLLDALAMLAPDHPGLRLVLIGDGEARAQLEAQARRLKLADRVAFVGSLDRDEIRDRLQAASLFVLPSRSEGMPVALLEAMACGLPCVAARVGGVPQALEDAGVTVPPESPAALAASIGNLLADPSARQKLAAAARTRAEAFAMDRAVVRYEALFRCILDGKADECQQAAAARASDWRRPSGKSGEPSE